MSALSDLQLGGACDAAFTTVRDQFAAIVRDGELGAALAVHVDGAPVVDLWGGWRDGDRTLPWERDTLVNTFSVTKGLMATCALQQVDRGLLDVDAPVSAYWPEFAAAGKDAVTVRQVLGHQAGLPRFLDELPIGWRYDWATVTDALARQPLEWEPGSRVEYHPITWGYLVGELLRRVDGRSPRDYLHDELTLPLRVDARLGLPAADSARCAGLALLGEETGQDGIDLADVIEQERTPQWRAAEVPAGNLYATARGVARVYDALAAGGSIDGVQVLRPDTLARALVPADPDLPAELPFGLGYMLVGRLLGASAAAAFGHPGVGGSLGLADPTHRIGFCFLRNGVRAGIAGAMTGFALLGAVYEGLGAT